MPLELPRTGLNGSALVELLAHITHRPAAAPSFVDGLGRWLGWKDAIALSAALQAQPAPAAPAGLARPSAAAACVPLDAAFARVRAALARTIDDALDEAAAGVDPRAGHSPGHSADREDFLPWRRACFRVQQAMDAAVAPLRAQARAALQAQAARHPHLATLAALDGALAQALAPREQAQLALMPVLLGKRFRPPATGPEPEATAGAFRTDMQRLLHAELELRLQPALGLLDALREAHTGSA